jgi:hypothetical protein
VVVTPRTEWVPPDVFIRLGEWCGPTFEFGEIPICETLGGASVWQSVNGLGNKSYGTVNLPTHSHYGELVSMNKIMSRIGGRPSERLTVEITVGVGPFDMAQT